MSSPLPPDPYVCLGVAKDADTSAIRAAHRRLALKYHPDRIRDEALQLHGQQEFTKVQQAYELLVDPIKRQRYDDQIKLAELRKEAMMRSPPLKPRSFPARPAPQQYDMPRPRTEFTDGAFVEERIPSSFQDYPQDRYEGPPRASARKPSEAEGKRPSKTETRLPRNSRFASFAQAGAQMKKMANEARARPKDQHKEHAARAEERDRTMRREREEKSYYASPHVDENLDMSDEGEPIHETSRDMPRDTHREIPRELPRGVPRDVRRDMPREPPREMPREMRDIPRDHRDKLREMTGEVPPLPREPEREWRSTRQHQSQPRYEEDSTKRRSPPESRRSDEEDEVESRNEDKWEQHHRSSREYIDKSQKRPGLDRTDSSAYHYWETDAPGKSPGHGDQEHPTSRHRRTFPEERPRPSMQTYNSAPSHLRPHVDPPRPDANLYPPERDHQPQPPSFNRSKTAPLNRTKDSAPPKSSSLRNSENIDSGYYSSSSPHTPEMREQSPSRTSRSKVKTSRYEVMPEPQNETKSHIRRTKSPDPRREKSPNPRRDKSPNPRRAKSPEPSRKLKEDRAERPRLSTETRSKTARPSLGIPENPVHRHTTRLQEEGSYEQRSPMETPTLGRERSHSERLWGEIPVDGKDARQGRTYNSEKLNVAPTRDAKFASYDRRGSVDPAYTRTHLQSPMMSQRRPSAYAGM